MSTVNVYSGPLDRQTVDNLQLSDRADIIITSVADTISIFCPLARIPIVDDAVRRSSETLHVQLNDERIDLFGTRNGG